MAQNWPDEEAPHHKRPSKADKKDGRLPRDLVARLQKFKPVVERIENKINLQHYNDFTNAFAPFQSASLKIDISRGGQFPDGAPLSCTINNDDVLANNKLGSLVTFNVHSSLKCEMYPLSETSLFIKAYRQDHWWNDSETEVVSPPILPFLVSGKTHVPLEKSCALNFLVHHQEEKGFNF